jgi:acetyl-CoA carboxylase biotin carboxyl carrier protein
MELTHDDVKKILEIIDSAEHLQEVDLVYGGFHLRVQRGGGNAGMREPPPMVARPAPQPALPSEAPSPSGNMPQTSHSAAPSLTENEVAIRAPMLGTFYRSPSPGAPSFVEVGQKVKADDIICLIEVMKLFSSIRAGVDGAVVKILPESGSLVQYDEVLVVISTAG